MESTEEGDSKDVHEDPAKVHGVGGYHEEISWLLIMGSASGCDLWGVFGSWTLNSRYR